MMQCSDDRLAGTAGYTRQIEAISRVARELDLDPGLGQDPGSDELESLEARILDDMSE